MEHPATGIERIVEFVVLRSKQRIPPQQVHTMGCPSRTPGGLIIPRAIARHLEPVARDIDQLASIGDNGSAFRQLVAEDCCLLVIEQLGIRTIAEVASIERLKLA